MQVQEGSPYWSVVWLKAEMVCEGSLGLNSVGAEVRREMCGAISSG